MESAPRKRRRREPEVRVGPRVGMAECLRLQDGRGVRVRSIVPADLAALRGFFAALTPAAPAARVRCTADADNGSRVRSTVRENLA